MCNITGCEVKQLTTWNDCLSPVAAYLKLKQHYAYACLLESAERQELWGRYSYIGLGAIAVVNKTDHKTFLSLGGKKTYYNKSPVKVLDDLFAKIDNKDTIPPALGYFGYDLIREYEKIPQGKKSALTIPCFLFALPEILLTFDHFSRTLKIEAFAFKDNNSKYQLEAKIAKILEIVSKNSEFSLNRQNYLLFGMEEKLKKSSAPKFTSNTTQAEFESMIKKAQHYIREGDIYQVVLSQRWEAEFNKDPFTVYRVLRHINPSPYLFYLQYQNFCITGSSPEVLIKKQDKKLISRPIAGTRPRGKNESMDKALEVELLSDKKELAEHNMLVDLARNDLGRISKFNTVEVKNYLSIENYSHVKHIVSTVESKALEDISFDSLIRAVFPAGTLSGAPKIRAMEIICELEKHRREFYAGAVARFSANKDVDSCIAIRSAVFKDGKVYVQAGAGIVKDSVAKNEYLESLAKANAVFTAINYANLI